MPSFLRDLHRDPEARHAFDIALANAQVGRESPSYEARLQWGDGSELAVRGTVYPLLTEGGQIVAIEGVLVDVSAEHAARQRAVQADRLSTLGVLAAGVAHEINNPAAFILLGLSTLERCLSELQRRIDDSSTNRMHSMIAELRDSTNRIVRIVHDLRVFASPAREPTFGAATDVNEAILSALSLTRSRISERAKLIEDFAEVPPVQLEDGRLVQVIVNLVINAMQALPRHSIDRPTIHLATRLAGERVEIEVSDNGVGIPKENLPRIWAPFFTTKCADLGSGLGLSISREIVERAGGSIRVESPTVEIEGRPRGSRFVVSLPASSSEVCNDPRPDVVNSTMGDATGPRLRVLLVEDEVALARALAAEVGRVHDVVVVSSGERALDALADARFDVVLCDLRMPGISGEDLYERVRATNSEQARDFIFMSGIGFVPEVERFLAATGCPVLHKPFPTAKVLQLISQKGASNWLRGAPTPA
jgi:signal transduction histidine kinase/CheY-like chemotaxis protein